MPDNYLNIQQALQKIELANEVFLKKKASFPIRPIEKVRKVGEILLARKEEFGRVITEEMGKALYESYAEIEKSALNCTFYADHCEEFLADRSYSTDKYDALVRYEPLGVILGVMPWNFPFWQAFRFAIPTILAGNTIVLKHASNVPKSAQLIEDIFLEAGFEPGTYLNLPLESRHIEEVLNHPYVKAVSLTGSEKAGSSVAEIAGRNIKKSVLELGGSNAFIVLDDADLSITVDRAIDARFRNAGQSCIAAKRFLVQEGIYEEFLSKFSERVKEIKLGDPFDPTTTMGPMSREDLAEELENQVTKSVEMGAKVLVGGNRNGAYFEPTILTDITTEMPVFKEETFGPVAVIMKVNSLEESIQLSNLTSFGLGVSIFSKNVNLLKENIHLFEEGAVFLNQMVRSDPALPFGGVKKSGFGRELSEEGIREFVNTKTVFIAKN
ncbi:NAD-dependent succinate-semialdehyde dehydrogenase [Moheibacter stercoris]|uniref:Succinate-semialdehyde dehydrogenase/glutarate-semialdehyde dehydrogenase n=1 Tax=Moheibacter stercoris TaxID=1628251 RepID=A0ABV2LU18_9FLAO